MFYFKDSEYCNSETKTGSTGSFIKYVEKHSCYKAAEKLLMALAEKNKECAVQLFPPKRKKKSSVDFYFEEIELSEEEINAFILLGKNKNALVVIFALLKKNKSEQIVAEKADQMYYEEMFSKSKINLIEKEPKPFVILPAYDKSFILMHPELKEYFVGEVPAERIFSTKLNIDFADGTWQLSVHKHEIARAQFSKDGKYVLVSGIKSCSEEISIFYDQITEIKTEKILNAAELEQFLKAEERK